MRQKSRRSGRSSYVRRPGPGTAVRKGSTQIVACGLSSRTQAWPKCLIRAGAGAGGRGLATLVSLVSRSNVAASSPARSNRIVELAQRNRFPLGSEEDVEVLGIEARRQVHLARPEQPWRREEEGPGVGRRRAEVDRLQGAVEQRGGTPPPRRAAGSRGRSGRTAARRAPAGPAAPGRRGGRATLRRSCGRAPRRPRSHLRGPAGPHSGPPSRSSAHRSQPGSVPATSTNAPPRISGRRTAASCTSGASR